MVYGIDENTLYAPAIYKQHYEDHNQKILQYFKYRPGDLLALNVSEADAMSRLCEFLGHRAMDIPMPHENRTNR